MHSSTTLSDLEKKLRSKSAHTDALELELSKAKALSSKFRNDNALLEEELQDAAAAGENLAQEMKEIALAKEESEAQMRKAQQKLASINQSQSTVQQQLSAALANHESLLADHQSLQSKSSTLQTNLTTANARLSTLEESSGSTIARRDDLLKENTGLLSSLEELRGKVVTLTNEQIALSDKSEATNRVLREKETELRAAAVATEQAGKERVELDFLRSELEKVVRKKEAAESAAAVFQQSIAELEERLDAAQSSTTDQHSRLAQLEDALALSRKESSIAAAARDEQSALVASHLATIAEHESKVEAARLATAEQLHQVELLRNGHEMLKVEHTDAMAKLAEFDQVQATLNAREKEFAALQQELVTAQVKFSEMDSVLELSNNAQESLIARIVKLESDLSTAVQDHQATTAALQSASDRAERLEGEASNSAAEVERLSEVVDELERELRELGSTKTDLDRITLAHDDLVSTNASLIASLEELRTSVVTLNDSDSSHAERAAPLSTASTATEMAHKTELEGVRKEALEAENARHAVETKLGENAILIEELQATVKQGAEEMEETMEAMSTMEDEIVRAREEFRIVSMELEADRERLRGMEGLPAIVAALQAESGQLRAVVTEGAEGVDAKDRNIEVDRLRVELEDLKELHARAQDDLASKDLEMEELRLRPAQSLPPPPAPLPNAKGKARSSSPYDQEYVDSISTQHSLDLSTARTQIRSLEQRLFNERDSIHQFMKTNGDLKSQIDSLVDELDTEREKTKRKERELESLRRGAPPFPVPLSPHEGFISPPLQRTPLSPSIPTTQPRFSSIPGATKEQRHARRESLSLLKTRMEDELGVDALGSGNPTTPSLGDDFIYCACCAGDMYVV